MQLGSERLYMLVGKRVRRIREGAGLTQAEVASRVGISRTSMVNIEAGRQRAPLHLLWRIAETVGTDPLVLFPHHSEYAEPSRQQELGPEILEEIRKAAKDLNTQEELRNFLSKTLTKEESRDEVP